MCIFCIISSQNPHNYLQYGIFSVYGKELGVEEMSVFGAMLKTYDEMEQVVMRNCQLESNALKSFRRAVGETVKVTFILS